jgi:putative glycosyltransferase
MIKLSIVATLYRSSSYISEFHARATCSAKQFCGDDYEIVLVNDGSPDDSLSKAVALCEFDQHVVVVDLSRNFGHHKAMWTGLEYARGEFIFLIDSDLEEEPEWLLDFAGLMVEQKADVVFGRQLTRKGGFFERWSGAAYYSFMNFICAIKHPRNIVTARLMTRRYVNALLRFQEREFVISYLWVITGFKQVEVVVKKHSTSITTYSISRRVQLLIDSITSFSAVPLNLIFYLGCALSACSMVYTVYLVFNRLFLSKPLDGWTSVIASIWLLGGMIICFIGVIGIYLGKIFSETKQRPHAIVRETYGRTDV